MLASIEPDARYGSVHGRHGFPVAAIGVTVELHATTQGSVWSHLYVCFDVRHQRHAVILVAADAWPAPHSMTILDHPM